MARQLRIEYPGAVYHVTSRGNARNAIYADDVDREKFLKVLHSVVTRYRWFCHAYCLMDNHYHLLIETPNANLSQGMRQLNGVYTQKYNKRHGLVGHLLQGRFKAIVVEKESYLLQLCRYIVQNPVAADIASTPGEWLWSSFQATCGLAPAPEWLSVDWVLSQFSENTDEARDRYREFVDKRITDFSPWDALIGRVFLGKEGFIEKLGPRLADQEQLVEVPKEERFAARPSLSNLMTMSPPMSRSERDVKTYRAYRDFGYTLKEIADFLGVHYATVSRAIKKVETHLLDCKT
ncbi:MAG: transposase [Desulfuromonadales bacterium]|nr:transposase [Desulfuromonadales bacterium]